MCWCYCGRECVPHVAAAECTAALSHAPSRRPRTPITAAPSEDPKHAHWDGGMWPERLEFLGSWHCG